MTVTRASAPSPPPAVGPNAHGASACRSARGHFPGAWQSWQQNTWSPARQLARSIIGGLGGDIASCWPTSYMATQTAKVCVCVCVAHKSVSGRSGRSCHAGFSRGQNTWADMHISLYILFFLLKNNSNKMTIRQASHANTLIRRAYNPPKHRLFRHPASPSFSPKTPTFSP